MGAADRWPSVKKLKLTKRGELMVSTADKKASKNGTEAVKPTWKIPPERVASDDCLIYIHQKIEDGQIIDKGQGVQIHKGEWVDLIPTQNIAELEALTDIKHLQAEGGGALRRLCDELSKRTTAWNWTDNAGEPLPQPYKNPDALRALDNDELLWILSATNGAETTEQRKND